jgi:hypothetical protein
MTDIFHCLPLTACFELNSPKCFNIKEREEKMGLRQPQDGEMKGYGKTEERKDRREEERR